MAELAVQARSALILDYPVLTSQNKQLSEVDDLSVLLVR